MLKIKAALLLHVSIAVKSRPVNQRPSLVQARSH